MKRLLKELFYWLLILAIVGFIGLFFLYPVIESGLAYRESVMIKTQEAERIIEDDVEQGD